MTNQDFDKIIEEIYANLGYNEYGYWLPERPIPELTDGPLFEKFVKVIKEGV